jgi:hypothetical protein
LASRLSRRLEARLCFATLSFGTHLRNTPERT